MNINLKPDYSYLFSNLSSRSNFGISNPNFLSDYASIKNGSYGKLLKAYYKKMAENDSTSTNTETNSSKLTTSLAVDSAKTLSSIDKAADSLKASAEALTSQKKDSVFTTKEVTTELEDGTTSTTSEYDKEAIYQAVSHFAEKYNSLLDTTGQTSSSYVTRAVSNMTNITSIYSSKLEEVGITVGDDNRLTVDADTLKAADMTKLKSLFNDSPSFAKTISSQASFVDSAASREATKANTYNQSGFYNNNYSMGNLFNGLL